MPRGSWWKNLALALAAPVVVFVAIELVLALVGVEARGYEDDPYVGFTRRTPLFVTGEAADGSMRWSTAPGKLRLFNAQSFADEKGRREYRVFCLGGSTTYGRPYDDATSFCGWLRELLPALDPSRDWKVVNAGGVSYASYRVALVMEELLAHEPDAFVLYTGHNEFLERRTYGGVIATPEVVRGLGALVSRTRTGVAMRRLLAPLIDRPARTPEDGEPTLLAPEVTTLLDGSVGPDAYRRDDGQRQRVLEHFRFNLARMADMARSADALLLLVEPAANLRDASPFKSQLSDDLDPDSGRRVEEAIAAARARIEGGMAAQALAAVDRALAIDERYAAAHYLRGKALDALGREDEAAGAYRRALEEDVCPLRAPEAFRRAVAEVAETRGLPLVDARAVLAADAPAEPLGAETFLDHVHPTIAAHRELALAILRRFAVAGVVEPMEGDEAEAVVARVSRNVEGRVDRPRHGQALVNVSKVLGWAGKLDEAGRLARRAIALAPELPEAHYQAGQIALLSGSPGAAIPHYRETVRLAPNAATAHGNLAAALERTGGRLQAIRHYRRAIELLGPEPSPYRDALVASLEGLGATAD